MYWRRSLIVTIILIVLGFGLNSIFYGLLVTGLYLNSGLSAAQFAQVSSLYSIVFSGLLHFFILWGVFRYYASPAEKQKRKNALSAQDVIQMLSEEEVAALRDHLLPPSQRTEP